MWEPNEFFEAYVDCAHWLLPEDEAPCPHHRCGSLRAMRKDCKAFIERVQELKIPTDGWTSSQAGHDFFLTRNGHGAGFWDRYWGGHPHEAAGDALSDVAKHFGETHEHVTRGRWYSASC